jgi:magnesium chelatase family protein
MYAATTSVALVGGEVRPVDVQVHIGGQEESFRLSGLPDAAVREAKDRVKAAIASSGIRFPNRQVTVNLAPADLPKAGTDFDLPIALGVLSAAREVPAVAGTVVVGELALDGTVRAGFSSFGAAVLSARTNRPCVLARGVASQAAVVPGSTVHGVRTLAEAVELMRLGTESRPPVEPGMPEDSGEGIPDLADVQGQATAKRSLEVAAAGGHHLLMHGPPGGGKTMLARRLPGILPPLSPEESVEVALIHNAAGVPRGIRPTRPFRSPHHTATRAALVGGGSGLPVPGEVSLSHRGVLFLDEVAEFPRSNLDTLRQPLEDGYVTIARKGVTLRFPSEVHLVAATNPYPCGFHGDRRRPCECRPATVSRYRQRVSGPLLDRIDLVVKVGRVETLTVGGVDGETTEVVRKRVMTAVEFGGLAGVGRLSGESTEMITRAVESGLLTARGATRLARLAVTIANLAASERVEEEHVAEAMALRVEW